MKTLFIILTLLVSSVSLGQTGKPTVVIHTSSECGTCKQIMEDKLNYVKGILFAELNMETKELTVKYNAKKITLDEIRKAISNLGYDADEVNANPEAVQKLPKCCQPGGMGK
jgi:periplasmic mercuric ion binding protein